MDPLTQQLMQRAMLSGKPEMMTGVGGAQTPPPSPTVPPNPSTKVPQQAKRFANAQAIQDAYRGDWTPNPVLLRAQLGNR